MNKNHFFIGYAGNKRNEFNNIYNEFLKCNKDIKYIVEPFCGTSAFSYFLSLKEPKKYTYILNDSNKYLIELYEISKDENKLNKLIEELDEKLKYINKEKTKYNILIKENNIHAYIIKNKIYAIRAGLFPVAGSKIIDSFKYLLNCPIINFMRNEKIILKNEDGSKILKDNDNKESFIFLDPPYLTECNDFYLDHTINIYEYLYNNNIKNFKCKILLILAENWIIRLLFKDAIKSEYSKVYEVSKKKINHLLITNY